MSNALDEGMLVTCEQVALRAMDLYVTQYLDIVAPGIRANMSVVTHVDEMARYATLTFRSKILAGDTTDETRTVEHTQSLRTFATWWDHLKYRIRLGRTLGWVPLWLRCKLPPVNWTTITRKTFDTVPVKVTRMCPHADTKFADNHFHAAFLKPNQFQGWPQTDEGAA